jgi:hypothetical protein
MGTQLRLMQLGNRIHVSLLPNCEILGLCRSRYLVKVIKPATLKKCLVVEVKQERATMGGRTTYRTLSPQRTPLQTGTK